ncbi:MAG: tyrosine-protein phosphatase [Chlamydiales bacterium]|nr:tyrosine-protein phosphatase [Chlamydiales bacterium]
MNIGATRERVQRKPVESDNIESESQKVTVLDFNQADCGRTVFEFSLPREGQVKRPLVNAVFNFDEKSKAGNYASFAVSRARQPDMFSDDELIELQELGAIPAPVMRKVAVMGHPFSAIEVTDCNKIAQVVNWLYFKHYLSREDAKGCMREVGALCQKADLAEQKELEVAYKGALMPHITSIMTECRNHRIAIFWLKTMITTLANCGLTAELGNDMLSGKEEMFEAFDTAVTVEVACKESLFVLGCYYIDPKLFEWEFRNFEGCDWEHFRQALQSGIQDYRLPNVKPQAGAAHLVVQNTIIQDVATFTPIGNAPRPLNQLHTKQETVLEQIKSSAYYIEGSHRQIVAKLDKTAGACLLGPIEGDNARLVLYFYNTNLELEYLRLQVTYQGIIVCGPLKIDNLDEFLLRRKFLIEDKKLQRFNIDDAKIAKEFDQISKEVFPQEYCQASLDIRVNRGGNTALAYDANRIKLFGEGYINASMVKVTDGISYICAQGPYVDAKCNSIVEFWQMVWQHNTPIILMLTELAANDKTQCSKYWPDVLAKAESYGDITVKCIDEQLRYAGGSQDHEEGLSIRVFKLSCSGHKPRYVYQLKYENWQEGQGANIKLVQRLINDTNYLRLMCGVNRPLLVHGSLGKGRTGTFVALHHILGQMQRFPKQAPDIQATVKELRKPESGRAGMVQTLAQYQFLYNFLSSNEHDKK